MNLYELAMAKKLAGGGGDEPVLINKNIDANGTYNASSDSADGYKKVVVSVPSSGITPSGTKDITSNGIYDVTNFASASVNVPGIVPSGTSSITANGIYDITNFASVDVNVSGGGGGDHDAEDGIIQRTISTIYNSTASFIGERAFNPCAFLEEATFLNASTVNAMAFMTCTSLQKAILPNVTGVGSSAFNGCYKLASIDLPKASFINVNAFANCVSLSMASLNKLVSLRLFIGSNAFYNCSKLMSVYVLGSVLASLNNNGVFTNTPMANSTYTGSFGSIYVPASLVDSYKAATNWSAYADRITSYVE